MCLIFTNPAGSEPLAEEIIRDIFTRNKDGYGVMYVQDGALYIDKATGTIEEAINFYNTYAALDVDTVFHFRYKTHGAISDDQSHPYVVLANEETGEAIALMHNGVLKTGNYGDVTKSDTWHFIKDYLTPIAEETPSILFNDAFCNMLGELIGSNRFVLLNEKGNMKIVNEGQGITWGDRWFSNTYAWNPELWGAVPPRPAVIPFNGYKTTSIYGGTQSYLGNSSSSFRDEPMTKIPPTTSKGEYAAQYQLAKDLFEGEEVSIYESIGENFTYAFLKGLTDVFDLETLPVLMQFYLTDIAEEFIYGDLATHGNVTESVLIAMESEAETISEAALSEFEEELLNGKIYSATQAIVKAIKEIREKTTNNSSKDKRVRIS